jgi:hypothetical protein
MSDGGLVVVIIAAVLLLWDVERIRKDATQMRLMMEQDSAVWREACREIVAISRMLEKEIHDQNDRRLRDELRE